MKFSFLVIFLLPLLVSCQKKIDGGDSIARVNEVEISVRDYLDLFETLKPKEHSLTGIERVKIKNLVIKTLVRRQIILSAAKERLIELEPPEIQRGLEKYRSDYPSTFFEESLMERMVDEEEWKRRVVQNLLIEKLFETTKIKIEPPSTKEALLYYQDHPHEFKKKAECTAYHIVVETEDLVKEIRKKVRRNPANFINLARTHSIGPEAQKDATVTVEKGIMPTELDNFLFKNRAGALSPVIKTDYGFHLLKIKRRSPIVNYSFEQVRQEILQKLTNQRKQAWMDRFEEKLIRQANIEYDRELIKSL